ncbi:MAG: hypothetical protein CSA32_03150 [Desulfobulbus propionicus]|nr:MAG: hypothetical protein CSA32_03150 [Desulfobulbus propionicus]
MKILQAILFITFLSIQAFTGCTVKNDSSDNSEKTGNTDFPVQLPATFSGKIADQECDFLQINLNLRLDHLYQMRTTCYVNNNVQWIKAHLRHWRYNNQERIVILGESKNTLKTCLVENADNLRFLDKIDSASGRKETVPGYLLTREKKYDPFLDTVTLHGMYSSIGNRHVLTECSSGKNFPVDPSGNFNELEKVYRKTPHQKNEALLVSFEGSLFPTPGGRKLRDRDVVIVKSFNRIYLDQDCRGKKTKKSIFDIQWTAVEIEGEPVTPKEKQRAPCITLTASGNQVSGFSGCNRLNGTFLFKGNVLLFNKLVSTRMACAHGVSLENRFIDALDKTEYYLLDKESLFLLDRKDKLIMRLKPNR